MLQLTVAVLLAQPATVQQEDTARGCTLAYDSNCLSTNILLQLQCLLPQGLHCIAIISSHL